MTGRIFDHQGRDFGEGRLLLIGLPIEKPSGQGDGQQYRRERCAQAFLPPPRALGATIDIVGPEADEAGDDLGRPRLLPSPASRRSGPRIMMGRSLRLPSAATQSAATAGNCPAMCLR